LGFIVELLKDRCLIFEHGGTALDELRLTGTEFTCNLMRQSANALFLLHNLGIAHFDIKPVNGGSIGLIISALYITTLSISRAANKVYNI